MNNLERRTGRRTAPDSLRHTIVFLLTALLSAPVVVTIVMAVTRIFESMQEEPPGRLFTVSQLWLFFTFCTTFLQLPALVVHSIARRRQPLAIPREVGRLLMLDTLLLLVYIVADVLSDDSLTLARISWFAFVMFLVSILSSLVIVLLYNRIQRWIFR